MSFTFNKAAVPTVTRATEPNPFDEAVKGLVGKDEALSFTLTVKTDEDEKMLAKTIGQLHKAGAEHNVSVRKTVKRNGTSVHITFWTVARISRPRAAK